MKTVSVINYKGGVGKTTLTANLAAELARRGQRILLIDMDPQASLTFSFVKPEEWEAQLANSRTVKNWFDSHSQGKPVSLQALVFQPPVSKKVPKGRLDLIASHLGLINVDLELATELGGASLKQAKHNYLKVHRRLAEGIAGLPENEYDLVVIDCPPNFNIATKNAIVASDFVLIPAKPDYLSTLGIDYLQRSLRELVHDYNDYAELDQGSDESRISPKILGVVFTMVQEYAGEPISAIRPFIAQTKKLQMPVFDTYVKENKTVFAEAPQYGLPAVLSSPSTPTHKQVVEGISQFVTEFQSRLQQA